MRFKFRARRCQFCCNVIGKWGALIGILNCNDCVRFMSTGRAPRCTCDSPQRSHPHGEDIAP